MGAKARTLRKPKMETSRRGVWKAPWVGPNGETVALILDSRNRLVAGPIAVPNDADVESGLWGLLDILDPTSTDPEEVAP